MFSDPLSIASFLLIICSVRAKHSAGILATKKDWAYLDRFCFISKDGQLQYTLQYPKSFELESLYLYYDANSQWKAAYGNDSATCRDREQLLDPANHQIIRLAPSAQFIDERSRCEETQRHNESWYRCIGTRSFFSMRPRWWYLAVGNCDSDHGLYLEYDVWMTNAPPGSRWHRQFSFDQFYSLPISLFFMLLQTALFVTACIIAYVLKGRKLLHLSYRLFLHSMFCQLVSASLLWVHLDKYADDGRGMPLLQLFSLFTSQFSMVLFVLLLLLVSKGYTITRARLRTSTSVKMVLFISAYFTLRIAMLVWALMVFDPAQVTYLSESVPAYCIATLNLLGWAWYCRSSWMTVSKYPAKGRFYLLLSLFVTLWFWSGPVVLVVANFVLDDWVRAEVVLGVESTIVAAGFIVFLGLTCPLANNRFFPFHVRTNQIGVQWDNFPHNVYEVQYASGSPGTLATIPEHHSAN